MSPINIQDILERAKNASRVGDHGTAERLLKTYIAKVPGSREAYLLLGNTFAKEGKLSDAADQFITLLARDPGDLEALNNTAVIYRRLGRLQEALDFLKKAIEIDPAKAEFHYNVGNIHKELGNFKASSMAYAKVIELDPSYVQAYNNLGTTYEQLKEYDKSFMAFRKGLALDQNNPTIHFNYGVALQAKGRLEDAANEYHSALRSKPGWLEPMNNLGIVHFMQGYHEKAMSTFVQVLKSDPSNTEAYNNMGVVLADQGRIQEAIKNYRLAIESDPKYTKAAENLERVLEASGDFADAVIELEKLIKLIPDSTDIRNRLSGLYLKLERYPEALEQAEAALKLDSESIQALRSKGAVLRIMGNDAKAQECFEKILSIDPGNYSFLLDLADIHIHRKEYKEAEDRVQSFLIQRPNDRIAKMFLGKLYSKMGNRTHAVQVFEELAKADPNDAEVLTEAAALHKEGGSLEKALRTADTLVNLQGKRATANDLTDLNKSLEIYENAVNAYSSSARKVWDRNIKQIVQEAKDEPPKEDMSQFMGAIGFSPAIDQETEALFIEDMEAFSDTEEGLEELILSDEAFNEIPEETATPRYNDPLDALAETTEKGPQDLDVSSNDSEEDAEPLTAPASPPIEPTKAETPVYPARTTMPAQPNYPQYSDYLPHPPYYPPGPMPLVSSPLRTAAGTPTFVSAEEEKMSFENEIYIEPSEAKAPLGKKESAQNKEISKMVDLMEHLKQLTEELPENERLSFSEGNLQANLESVIDSLKNLTII
jgi:tetratricopeptide (TPR) repeat protein